MQASVSAAAPENAHGAPAAVRPARRPCHPMAGLVSWANERGVASPTTLLAPLDPEPAGDDWVRLDRFAERVPALIETLVERSCEGHRTSAAAFLSADLGREVLGLAAVTGYLAGRVPELAPERLWVRVMPTGRVWGLALRQGSVAVLEGDPMARRPGVAEVHGEDALDARLVHAAVAVVEPVVAAIRACTRFGTRPQWSMVADSLFSALLTASDEVGLDQRAAWERARRMADRLNDSAPRVTPRQRAFPMEMTGRPARSAERLFLVRGGCCFYYKFGDTACAGCPLTADTDREPRLRELYDPAAQTTDA